MRKKYDKENKYENNETIPCFQKPFYCYKSTYSPCSMSRLGFVLKMKFESVSINFEQQMIITLCL